MRLASGTIATLCVLLCGFPGVSAARSVRLGVAPREPAGARVLGPLAASSPLHVTVALAPRDPMALEAYALAVSTPGSPDFHHYLTVSEFAARFGPTAATVAAVRSSLVRHGLRPGPLSTNGLALPVAAPASAVGSAFSTSFARVSLPGSRVAFANTSAPELDAFVAAHVQAVTGLEDVSAPQPLGLRRLTQARGAHLLHPNVGSGPQPCTAASTTATFRGGYTFDQIANAYGAEGLYQQAPAGDMGAGQTIAVYELEDNNPSDISAFQSCYGTSANVTYVSVDGGPPALNVGNGDGLETGLDVESLIGIAPLAKVTVYQSSQSGAYDTYNRIVSDDLAQVVSTSWGQCEPDLGSSEARAESTLFQEAAIQGQTVVAASGDAGAQDCANPDTGSPTTTAVDDPASQPFVTGVGGTSLTVSPARGEAVWNNGSGGTGAGGGGDSLDWPMPAYQLDTAPSLGVINADSSTACNGYCREVPDVSLDADPNSGFVVYWNGGWIVVGGTSGSAPAWGALIALANASSPCAGSPVGFANPKLYGAAGTSRYSSYFNDVIFGNNDWQRANGGAFAAHAGYDQATGLGTPNAAALAPALCAGTVSITEPSSQNSTAGVPVSLQLQASYTETAAFIARALPPGLSVNSQTGLISGVPTASGTYEVTVGAVTTHQSDYARFTWSVAASKVTLIRPANQRGRLRVAVGLQLRASANNGQKVGYTVTGLPPGLSLNSSSGRIAGTPTAAGTYAVAVSAHALAAASATSGFTWRIVGPPTLARASLSGIASGKGALMLRFAAGINAPALKVLTVKGASGVLFASAPAQAVQITGPNGKRLGFTARVARGVLKITLRSGATQPTLTVKAPALTVTPNVSGRVQRHRLRVSLTATAVDTTKLVTRFSVSLTPH